MQPPTIYPSCQYSDVFEYRYPRANQYNQENLRSLLCQRLWCFEAPTKHSFYQGHISGYVWKCLLLQGIA